MEWIRRNPKSAAALSALAVLCAVLVVWAMSGSSSQADEPSALGSPSPSATTSRAPLTALPSATSGSVSLEQALAAFGGGATAGGALGGGAALNLDRHRIEIAVGSDGPILGVGWKIPLAEGERQGKDSSGSRTFRHSTHTYGDSGYAFLGAYIGAQSSRVWCTIRIDGKVIERQEANSPYGQVYCYA